MTAPGTTRRRGRRIAVVVGALVVVVVGFVAIRSNGAPRGTFADAVSSGDAELARQLADAGVDPDTPRRLGMTPLMRAANRNDVALIRVLIDAGADLHATAPEGLTAVHIAAQADAADALVVLGDLGADLEAMSLNGMAPLHHAAATGSVRAIDALVQLGVDIDSRSTAVTQGHGYPRDIGATALGIAARAGHEDAVRLLVGLGAGVDEPSEAGHTPLQLAVFAGSPPEVVIALLVAGADPHRLAACDLGCAVPTADSLGWARRLGHDDLVPVLEAAVAEPRAGSAGVRGEVRWSGPYARRRIRRRIRA